MLVFSLALALFLHNTTERLRYTSANFNERKKIVLEKKQVLVTCMKWLSESKPYHGTQDE